MTCPLTVILVLSQEPAHGTFEAQDRIVTGNLVTSREDLHTQQGAGNVLHTQAHTRFRVEHRHSPITQKLPAETQGPRRFDGGVETWTKPERGHSSSTDLHFVVARGEGQVDDQTELLVLFAQRIQQLPGTEHIRGRQLAVQSLQRRRQHVGAT